jgi:hypothetical protein
MNFTRFCILPLIPVLVLAAPLAAGCSQSSDDSVDGTGDALTSATSDEVAKAQATDVSNLQFDLLTPTSLKIMKASHYWMGVQSNDKRYPQPRMCASNVSKVLFLSAITRYDQEGVRALISDVGSKGASIFKMPQDKAGFLKKLASIHGGHIPAGTIVAGENVHSSNPGDQHVGVIGHTDPDGTVWAYHNNWYRPDNEHGQRKPFMVSDENLKRGFQRQWMAVPWVKLTRDASGNVTDAAYLIPGIDDMNPFNKDYQTTLAITQEIEQDIAAGRPAELDDGSSSSGGVPAGADDGTGTSTSSSSSTSGSGPLGP